ncbi:MAG: aspartate aminotransferase, partial [Clostridia bacterium]|nr:aspartate aminotransferase [Clostridia bacterium]
MKFDFTSIIDRRGKDAIAVDVANYPDMASFAFGGIEIPKDIDVIPMWVADMNFPACPTIPEAIIDRVNHPTYGYFKPRAEYFDSIIKWHETRNGVTGLLPEHIG